MIPLLLANVKAIGLAIGAFFTVYILRKNKALADKNEILTTESSQKNQIIDIQQKVLDESQDIKPVSLDDNITRMRDKNNPL